MGTEQPKAQDSSGDSDSNSESESSSGSETSGSDWECSKKKQNNNEKPHFSVTSCDTGLKLKIAAIQPRKTPGKTTKPSTAKKKSNVSNKTMKAKGKTEKTKKSQLSDTSSSSDSCSKCSSDTSSEDDLPLKIVSKTLPPKHAQKTKLNKCNILCKSDSEDEQKIICNKDSAGKPSKDPLSVTNINVKKTKSDEGSQETLKRRGRPRAKFVSTAVENTACGTTSSSSSTSSSSPSSSSSSSSDSDTAEAGGSAHASSADDSSAALVAACSLQVIDDADLAELFPEQTPAVPAQPANFSSFGVHNNSPHNDNKSNADNGDGSSSEMELPPQLVSAAIQRATADSSSSENECSNSETPHQNTTHYASSLLQQFVAQTQLLSSTAAITSIGASTTPAISCGLPSTSMDGVGPLNECVLGQMNALTEINPNFLGSSQHLSPQQNEELTQINKDLEEISSVSDTVGISLAEPPSLDDCVDNNDFMSLAITQADPELGNANDLIKSSPMTVGSADMTPTSQIDSQKLDTVSTNSVESQEDLKNVVIDSRRKRGRPRKVRHFENKTDTSRRDTKSGVKVIKDFHNNDPPNVSPDSGILSNHNSPTHSPFRRNEVDESNRVNKKSAHKENNLRDKRTSRSKSQTRSRTRNRSDSSDSEYQRKTIENGVRKIKTEAPSPIPQKQELLKYDKPKRNDHKLDIAALDRMLYATDRVLYPPRKRMGKKTPNRAKVNKPLSRTMKDKNQYDSNDSDDNSEQNKSVLSGVYAKRKELNSKLALPKAKNTKTFTTTWRDNQSENEGPVEDPLDPTWKQIDLNPKYKDILSGYKSDYEFKPYKSCSRLIESGYKSDYGCRSGYKSDCRSGYKSDHRSGYKTDKSGYKTDYSVRSTRRHRMRKLKKTRSVRDRTYYKNQKHFVSDHEVLLLANKTFSRLNLGHSSSDSEGDNYNRKSSDHYSGTCTVPLSKLNYSFCIGNDKNYALSSDPFAPGPVFSNANKPVTYNIFKASHNNNMLLKSPSKSNYLSSPLPALKPVFTHKFGVSPICTVIRNQDRYEDDKQCSRNVSPKTRKVLKNGASLFSIMKKENISKPMPGIFEKARNTYVPSKSISKNIFLHSKKPHSKPVYHSRRHKRTVVLTPPKINLKPTERLSRVTVKQENRHHRHRSKKRRRSRSASRCRDSYKSADGNDEKDIDNLIHSFIKLCQIAPSLLTVPQISSKSQDNKQVQENIPTKLVKRGSKKRKTSDNQEIVTPTSKRRHKKQLTESQNKGGKDANEHKLPLKKRHYHINSSTINSINLSLVSTEFDENLKNGQSSEKFLCTETNCMGELPNNLDNNLEQPLKCDVKTKKSPSHTSTSEENKPNSAKTNNIEEIPVKLSIQINQNCSSSRHHSPISSNCTDDELAIQKPSPEQSELSKKIYETSEKLKAVHKMVNDLEKSLPKSKDSETKIDLVKSEAQRMSSPKSEAKLSPLRNPAPIVTPKKRHRLEVNKTNAPSSLDQVVQSLSKKLADDKASVQVSPKDKNKETSTLKEDKTEVDTTVLSNISTESSNNNNNNNNILDPMKSMSARTLYKSSIPPAQKSEIMTRKKNRLEGLTSNLVSKINPSAATKVLDTLLNNNIRKSIESRIMGKEKTTESSVKEDKKISNKDISQINTRATVIKSPVPKTKTPTEIKKIKATEEQTEHTVLVNVDRPTGIFEPSIDLEDQIPKSSICISNILEANKNKNKSKDKVITKSILNSLDGESDIPLALIAESSEPVLTRPKRGESIAAVISDKLQETIGGHNLRHQKRNITHDADDSTDKKKKKTCNSIIRESKLVLPPKILVPKGNNEKVTVQDQTKKKNQQDKKKNYNKDPKNDEVVKKKARRRKTFNRTGFPSIKRKKKKVDLQNQPLNDTNKNLENLDSVSAFERVPKDGEAMNSFLERTSFKKTELKVVLNKEDCPKQGRLTVVALEKLQGKSIPTAGMKNEVNATNVDKKNTNLSILRAPSLQLKQNKNEKDKSHINKWEVLSETDSIPSLSSFNSNDPEDCIPLSLLNVKAKQTVSSQLDNIERLKRKCNDLSPSREVEDIIFSKRKNIEKSGKEGLRPKSSLAVLCPAEKRLTRSSDNTTEKVIKKINKKVDAKKPQTPIAIDNVVKLQSIVGRRKSRSCQMKKTRELDSSSRDSSLETLGKRMSPSSKSRETSVDTLREQDENEPLPLNEKEIDFEKSIDVLSKSIICKKRMASSRDDSPVSNVDSKERDRPVVSKRNPRLRKKFLVAGLFSDYYKDDSKPESRTKNSAAASYDYPSGLLGPPTYCERWVRRRLQHFTLPYDIWWQQHYNQPVPSWNYKKIRTNMYYDVKPSAEECESVACNCAPDAGCPEDCINKLVFCECSPQLCPCGDKCKNQRIQRHEWASGIEKFMTVNKGWGVRTKHQIKSGDFILEYVGEVVSDKEFKERMATRYARDTHHYCLHLDGGLVIDGHRMGGDGRFVNHSCRPNCEMQKWTSNGTFRMALFALRDIEPDEELTYDYNFSLFNPAVGQPCKCDSEDCRGVIGGKSQRITKPLQKSQSRTPSNTSNQSGSSTNQQPRVGRPRKAVKCNKKSDQPSITACDIKNMTILKYQQHLNKLWQEPQMKPLTAKEKTIVKDRHCFLFRNLEKVRKLKERLAITIAPAEPLPPEPKQKIAPATIPVPPIQPTAVTYVNPLALPDSMNSSVFLSRLQALRAPREECIKKLSQLVDNKDSSKKERLNNVFKVILDAILNFKGDKDESVFTPLIKRRGGELANVLTSIDSAQYESVAQFDSEFSAVLSQLIREQGQASSVAIAAGQLKKIYNSVKMDFAEHITKTFGTDEPLPAGFLQKTKPEEVIMCICGLHVEEGLMVQCGGGGCGVWQHARCMRVNDTMAHHYCHHCCSDKVDREIPLEEYTEDGHQFYLSLMRGELQVRQGDTVYVLRDIPIDDKHPDVSRDKGEKGESPRTKRMERKKVKNMGKEKTEEASSNKDGEVRKHTYQTIGEIPVSELDIFRVERLWKHRETNERYVYGHHYLRPHETFHEPTRKFFPNEVMRVPLYEAVPIELVMSQCWVMDLNTYCKGRPVGACESHVYISELRVDRTARLFTKVSRPRHPICTKPYAFDHFPQRQRPARTYAPHEVSPEYLKGRAAKNNAPADKEAKSKSTGAEVKKKPPPLQCLIDTKVPRRERQKERVNNIARRLLARGFGRAALDASYLLDTKRARRRPS